MIKGLNAFNDLAVMDRHHKRATNWFEQTSLKADRLRSVTCGSVHLLYMYHRTLGEMQDEAAFIEKNYGSYENKRFGCQAGFADQVMAENDLERGNCQPAYIHASKAMLHGQKKAQEDLAICGRFAMIRSLIGQDKPEEVLDGLALLKRERDQCGLQSLIHAYDMAIGYLSYILQDERGFAQWLRGESLDENLHHGMGFAYVVMGQWLLLNREYIRLEMLGEKMDAVFAHYNHIFGYIHAYILDAIAKFHLYGFDQAAASLRKALEYARTDGILSPFCEYAWDLNGLMAEYMKETKGDLFTQRLLREKDLYIGNLKKLNERSGNAIILTAKEKEIVRLMLEGKSNREIATELFVAEITVKKHVSAIYKKLDVRGRTSAVKRCMELHIL